MSTVLTQLAQPAAASSTPSQGSLGSILNKAPAPVAHLPSWDSHHRPAVPPSRQPTSAAFHAGSSVASGLPAPAGPAMSAVSSPLSATFPHHHNHVVLPPPSALAASPYTRDFPPPLAPRHWTVLKEVGDGSFGTVWLADWHSPLNLPPGTQPPGPSSRPEYKGKQLVAIKRMKKAFEGGWDECMKLKELKSLRQIPMHPNIIPLYDAFLLPSSRELYFVFECMEGNLYQLTKSRKGRPLASGLTASIFYQILAGLNHIHTHGYFHRDLKPENLLITTTGLADYPASALYALPGTPPEKDVVVVVKLADFGLAREITSKPPYTEYVSTRWYRAPEVLLRSRDYSVPVDMWALGTILVEVLTLKPLFPGDSEVDQVYKICEVLGDPSTDYGVDERGRTRGGGTWARGIKMAKDVGFAFPKIPPRNFAALFDQNVVPIQLIDCIADLLRYEPKARLTTQQCLDHAYFREVAYRFTPYAPPQTHQQLPTPAPSHGSGSSPYGSTISVNTAGLVNGPSQASPRSIPPSHSHSAQPAASFHLPYPSDPNGQALPSPDHYARQQQQAGHPLTRQFSISSGMSGNSGLSSYQVQVQQAAAPNGEVPTLGFSSPAPSVAWSGHGDAAWGQMPNGGLHPMQGGPARRGSLAPSVAPSTLYDGSVFEGVAPSRASSVMSFPVSYNGGMDASTSANPAPSLHSPSLFQLSPQTSRVDGAVPGPSSGFYASSSASVLSASPPNHYPQPHPSQHHQQQQQTPDLASSPASNRSGGRWGLSGVLAGSTNPLKRSPSNASIAGAASIAPSSFDPNAGSSAASVFSADPKKAKKEAEKLAKEQEKANRIAKEQAARERARAVMKKKNQLMEAADPLHNVRAAAAAAAAAGQAGAGGGGGVPGGAPSAADKGKGRALPSDRMVAQRMPQIIEDTSRLYLSPTGSVSSFTPTNGTSAGPSGANGVGGSSKAGSFLANRFKARRRDDDDDVHSVSSNETGASVGSQQWPFPVGSGRGRTFSISSKATSASDPERRQYRGPDFPVTEMDPLALGRVSSISSLPAPSVRSLGAPAGGPSSLHRFPSYGHYTAPSTGHSSLDSNFLSHMQGLATTSTSDLPHLTHSHPHPPSRSESHSRQRLASPSSSHHPSHPHHHHAERYSPYALPSPHMPRSPGPTLPPISSFDQAQQQYLRKNSTAAGSIASFHSQPGSMPSYFVQPPGSDGGAGVGGVNGNGNGAYHLPHLPAMDTDDDPPASAPNEHLGGGAFPYPTPGGNGLGIAAAAAAGQVPHQMAPG
ncbi:hypothetical protein JCM8097_008836 [Rhodosporidiobolus ruineniae]